MTPPHVKLAFPLGARIRAFKRSTYCLRGKEQREGVVAGYSTNPSFIRVTFDGWKSSSTVAIAIADVERVA